MVNLHPETKKTEKWTNTHSLGGEKCSPQLGIEPRPSTWQAEILTTRLLRNRCHWSMGPTYTWWLPHSDRKTEAKKNRYREKQKKNQLKTTTTTTTTKNLGENRRKTGKKKTEKYKREKMTKKQKNRKKLPRAGFEPATYGCLTTTTTVHRSTNWAIEGHTSQWRLHPHQGLPQHYTPFTFECQITSLQGYVITWGRSSDGRALA